MKRIHTQAKKANRRSAFGKAVGFNAPSRERALKREDMQARETRPFGLQIRYKQRIFLGHDRFGAPLYKVVCHPVIPVTPKFAE